MALLDYFKHIIKLVASLTCLFLIQQPLSFAKQVPNILLITVDDLRPSINVLGDEKAITPNLDTLANSSLIFDKAYISSATCSPSRASLMSGLRPDALQIFYSRRDTRLVEDSVPLDRTFNGFFKSKGYETIGIGKVYHKASDSSKGWSTEIYDHSNSEAFQKTRGGLSPQSYLKMLDWDRQYPDTRRPFPWEAAEVSDDAYPDGLNTQFAILELHRLKQQAKPFFMVMGYKKPHLPFNCPKQYWDMYMGDNLPLPTRFEPPLDSPEYAINNSGELRTYPFMPKNQEAFTKTQMESLNQGYYACISYIDSLIGKLLTALESTGLDKNTIVVVWGDHGYKLGRYGQYNKHTNYEVDTRVPFFVRTPGYVKGARTKAIVESVDIFPSMVDLAGLEIPEGLAGKSFKTILDNPDSKIKYVAFQQFPRRYKGQSLMGYAVRSQRYRYVAWIDWGTGELVAQELYDHNNDPQETQNVAKLKVNMTILEQHEAYRLALYPPTLLLNK